MFIQNIQNGMGKSPQEKERSNQDKGNKILLSHQWYPFLFHHILMSKSHLKVVQIAAAKINKTLKKKPIGYLMFPPALSDTCL